MEGARESLRFVLFLETSLLLTCTIVNFLWKEVTKKVVWVMEI